MNKLNQHKFQLYICKNVGLLAILIIYKKYHHQHSLQENNYLKINI